MSAPDTPNVCPTCDDTGLVAPLGGRGSDGPDPCPHCTPAPGSSSPDTAALVERLHDITRSIWRGGEFHYQLVLEQCGDIVAAADALEAQAARIARLEAAIRAALHRATMRSSPDYELEDVLNGGTDG